MVLSLITNISLHPLQVARPKADDAVAGLPLQHFSLFDQLLIDLVRRRPLELADEIR